MGVFDFLKKQDEEEPTKETADIEQAKPDKEPSKDKKRLLFFYGEECPHCHNIMPRLDEVEEKIGVKFERFEVWHNADNAKMNREYDKDYCGGVPFLYNTANDEWVCGAVEVDKIRAFAQKG